MVEKTDQFSGCVAWQNSEQKDQFLASGILFNFVGFSSKNRKKEMVRFYSLSDQEDFLQMQGFMLFQI